MTFSNPPTPLKYAKFHTFFEPFPNSNIIKVSGLRQPKEANLENGVDELTDFFENQEEAVSGPSPDFNIDVNFG